MSRLARLPRTVLKWIIFRLVKWFLARISTAEVFQLVQSGISVDFSALSDDDYLLAMQRFSSFTTLVYEGVGRELEQRQRGIMYCAKCGEMELMKDPGSKILPKWKPWCVNVLFYFHVCEAGQKAA